MTSSAPISFLPLEFDDFLFARIDENGDTPLSILSVLSRLGVDPWEEAARLAQLPPSVAAAKLALSISSIPDAPSAYLDAGTVCHNLISLLPAPRPVANLPHDLAIRPAARSSFVLWAVLIAMILFMQLVLVSNQSPRSGQEFHAPSASQALPSVPR
jgi:hypothetical protein